MAGSFLISLPYLASAILYLIQYYIFWRPPKEVAPMGWQEALIGPILISCFVPLGTVATVEESLRSLFYSITGIYVFVGFLIVVITNYKGYLGLITPVIIGGRTVFQLKYIDLIVALGMLLLISTAVVAGISLAR